MKYYSHAKQDSNGLRIGSKLLVRHTMGVRDKALASLFLTKGFLFDKSKLEALISQICIYHDLGKYTTHFQNYLLDKEPYVQELKQHARFGAFVLLNKLSAEREEGAFIAWYVIVHHHSSLWDIAELRRMFKKHSDEQCVFDRQIPSFKPAFETAATELEEPNLEAWLRFPDVDETRKRLKSFIRNTNILHYFLTNYLFSLLIEADKLDASDSEVYKRKSPHSALVDDYKPLSLPKDFERLPFTSFSQNELRSYVRWQVSGHFKDREEMLHYRLFTLTAPTGIGKTLTALDFALKLKQVIRETEGREAQIIYGLPFINIIEQAIPDYEKALKNEASVLAHYQFADALEFTRKSDRDPSNENLNYNQRQMLMDTWQSDVVITTFVQLLQTLIGYRNKLLLKFHHLAGSIIILDEIQAMKREYLPLIGATLNYLAKFLETRILVMTATRPKIYELAQKEILDESGEMLLPQKELLTNYDAVFSVFKRTKIIPLISEPISDEEEFWDKIFMPYWTKSKSCLIVVNTVKRSLQVFDYLKKNLDELEINHPLYYLSTNIVPAHRMDVIRRVKEDLEAGLKPLLVSTQSIEAGVDLSFEMAFRDLAPIDSIIQVAGRVNRNNKKESEHSPVYVMDFGDCDLIYGKITTPIARKTLEAGKKQFPDGIYEENYFKLIEGYFDTVASRDSFQASRDIFKAMASLKYDGEKENGEVYVSSFRVIEDRGFAVSVFIECDDEASKALKAFSDLGRTDMSKHERKEAFEPFKRAFHQHIITVPKYLPKMEELIKMDSAILIPDNIWVVRSKVLKEYYDLETGFIRLNDNSANSQTISF